MQQNIQPEIFYFEDGSSIPNSKYPLLIYRKVFIDFDKDAAGKMEEVFAANGWTNSWRNGIYPFHHYHSTAHEVLGIYKGSALLQLGGGQGRHTDVEAGDVIIIPAGVGHINLGGSFDFAAAGAYAGGHSWDVMKGEPGERPGADENIQQVPLPEQDPVYGKKGMLLQHWQ